MLQSTYIVIVVQDSLDSAALE